MTLSEDIDGVQRLERELEILWNLHDLTYGESSRYIVQCSHHGLVSSSLSSSSAKATSAPVITSRLSIPTPITGFIMEQGGPTLNQFLLSTAVALPSRIQIVREVVEALRFLHRRELVHLNLNPNNIFLGSGSGSGKNHWKLSDFSHSCVSGNTIDMWSTTTTTSLNLEYCAPELVRHLASEDHLSRPPSTGASFPASPQLDIWSLGMVAVLVLSGSSAWELLFPDGNLPNLSEVWDGGDEESRTMKSLFSFLQERLEEEEESFFLEQCLKSRSSCEEILLSAKIFSVPCEINNG
jgi:serine/threonine protein kinase